MFKKSSSAGVSLAFWKQWYKSMWYKQQKSKQKYIQLKTYKMYNNARKFIYNVTVSIVHHWSATCRLYIIKLDKHTVNMDNSDYDSESSSVVFSRLHDKTLIWMSICSDTDKYDPYSLFSSRQISNLQNTGIFVTWNCFYEYKKSYPKLVEWLVV